MYWPVVSHPVLRRLLPGYALSALGDGMAAVAVAWLALQLAPSGRQGLWVGAALAAYSLPGAVGAALFGRWLRGRRSTALAAADAALRAAALGMIAVLASAGTLPTAGYIGLLAASSVLHAWGLAGEYALVAEILPSRHRVAGNALLGATAQIAIMAGPTLAGVITAVAGPAVVIGADAATFAVLAISYLWAAPLVPRPESNADQASRSRGGWQVIRASRMLSGLLGLTFVFYALYGPVEVALPVWVGAGLHRSAELLGWFWTLNAAGVVIGSLCSPWLRRWPLWPAMIAIVAGWGLALVPLGLGAPVGVCLAAFAAGGVIFAPYLSLSSAVFQDACPPSALASVMAARASLLLLATPIGTTAGAPLVASLGSQGTMLASALATVALAAGAAAVLAAGRCRRQLPNRSARP